MSYDFDLKLAPCDHLQIRERMTISQDFRTLRHQESNGYMRGPVSAKGSVRLFISGQEILPSHETYGWEILPDETSVASDQRSKIVFRYPFRLSNVLIEVQYVTIPAYCLKCNGYSKTNDFKVERTGTFNHITEYDKLVQRVYKFLLTSKCPFYPTLTSRLKDFVGRKIGGALTEDDITYECLTTLDNLKQIQQTQKTVQTLSPQEVLKNVESISTERDKADPSLVSTKMTISSFGVPRPSPLAFTIRTTKG